MRRRRSHRPLLAALLLAVGWGAGITGPAARAAPPPRTLFILLDAVPWRAAERATDPRREGGPLLAEFSPPVPLVSSFPSSTSVATVGLFEPFGLERSPGYEARYFDWERRKVRGGGAVSYFRIDFPWRDFFDWSRKGVARTAVGALRPLKVSVNRMEDSIEAFFESDDPTFFVYHESLDTAAHLHGPDSLDVVFAELDRALASARRRHPDASYRVVLFSDHGIAGGEELVNVADPVRRALRQTGFRPRRRLVDRRDVVLTPFGLVSSFEVYSQPGTEPRLAALLARVPGVDLCAWPEEGGWRVEAAAGGARFDRFGRGAETRWSYEPLTADPLDYQPVVRELGRRAGEPSRRRFPDEWWFEATAARFYPDALHRIARGFDLVENRASVLCSLAPGHMYGLEVTEVLARIGQGRLRWTHGALYRDASWGFLMSDDPGWRAPAATRFDRALALFVASGEAEP